MAHYLHGCTPSESRPGYCADCGEPLVPLSERVLLIPDELEGGRPHPVPPGDYTRQGLVELLRDYQNNPEAIQFIANMLEE